MFCEKPHDSSAVAEENKQLKKELQLCKNELTECKNELKLTKQAFNIEFEQERAKAAS